MDFRTLKYAAILAFTMFCIVWAYISIMKQEMYVPPIEIMSGLGTLLGGRLIQTYAEK